MQTYNARSRVGTLRQNGAKTEGRSTPKCYLNGRSKEREGVTGGAGASEGRGGGKKGRDRSEEGSERERTPSSSLTTTTLHVRNGQLFTILFVCGGGGWRMVVHAIRDCQPPVPFKIQKGKKKEMHL